MILLHHFHSLLYFEKIKVMLIIKIGLIEMQFFLVCSCLDFLGKMLSNLPLLSQIVKKKQNAAKRPIGSITISITFSGRNATITKKNIISRYIFPSERQESLLNILQNNSEAKPVRDFLIQEFDGIFIK